MQRLVFGDGVRERGAVERGEAAAATPGKRRRARLRLFEIAREGGRVGAFVEVVQAPLGQRRVGHVVSPSGATAHIRTRPARAKRHATGERRL